MNNDRRIHDSKTPDDDIFRNLSITYASRNPLMHAGNTCKPDNFSEGITNGAIWYEVRGECCNMLLNMINNIKKLFHFYKLSAGIWNENIPESLASECSLHD